MNQKDMDNILARLNTMEGMVVPKNALKNSSAPGGIKAAFDRIAEEVGNCKAQKSMLGGFSLKGSFGSCQWSCSWSPFSGSKEFIDIKISGYEPCVPPFELKKGSGRANADDIIAFLKAVRDK